MRSIMRTHYILSRNGHLSYWASWEGLPGKKKKNRTTHFEAVKIEDKRLYVYVQFPSISDSLWSRLQKELTQLNFQIVLSSP